MPRHNFLLGNGHQLTDIVPYPKQKQSPKTHPYTYEESRARLLPRIEKTVGYISELPSDACWSYLTIRTKRRFLRASSLKRRLKVHPCRSLSRIQQPTQRLLLVM